MNLSVKNEPAKKAWKIVFENVLPNIFFFCLGIANVVFQLDAVEFAN